MIGSRKKALLVGGKPAAPFSRAGSWEANDQNGWIFNFMATSRNQGSARTGEGYIYITQETGNYVEYRLDRSIVSGLLVTVGIYGKSSAPSQGILLASTNDGASFAQIGSKIWSTSFELLSGSIRVGRSNLRIRFSHNNAAGIFDDWSVVGVK